jgi:hypothetical protein
MKNFVCHTSRNSFASIRTRLSTRTAKRTHARKRAVSGLVIQITIVFLCVGITDNEEITN